MAPPIDYETLRLIWWLLMGLLLIGFVIVAPTGIVGLWQSWFGKGAKR